MAAVEVAVAAAASWDTSSSSPTPTVPTSIPWTTTTSYFWTSMSDHSFHFVVWTHNGAAVVDENGLVVCGECPCPTEGSESESSSSSRESSSSESASGSESSSGSESGSGSSGGRRQLAGIAEGLRPRRRHGPQARAPSLCSRGDGGGSGLCAACGCRPAAAQFSQGPRRRPWVPA